jgi:hypothetical protein
MGNAPKEIREVGIDDFPVSAKQQFFDLGRRLLGIPPRPAVRFSLEELSPLNSGRSRPRARRSTW